MIMRTRRTKSAMEYFRRTLREIAEELRPATVRQVFYQAVVRGVVDKTERAYSSVAEQLAEMRKSGRMPYEWLADGTRWQRKTRTHDSLAEAIASTAQFYRRDALSRSDRYIEVWLEKEALAGVIISATREYDVPLMVARGFASLSFLYSAAKEIECERRPTTIYHLGDYDPSGQRAAASIRSSLIELSGRNDMTFIQLAVNPEQIAMWSLPTRPTKTDGNSHAKGWVGESVELDAIHPDTLRQLVRDAIAKHIPHRELKALRAAEESERSVFTMFGRELARYKEPGEVLGIFADDMAEGKI